MAKRRSVYTPFELTRDVYSSRGRLCASKGECKGLATLDFIAEGALYLKSDADGSLVQVLHVNEIAIDHRKKRTAPQQGHAAQGGDA